VNETQLTPNPILVKRITFKSTNNFFTHILILPYPFCLRPFSSLLAPGFLTRTKYASHPPSRALCSAHQIVLNFIHLLIYAHKVSKLHLRNFLHPPARSFYDFVCWLNFINLIILSNQGVRWAKHVACKRKREENVYGT
jgi:hypothetical protein